MNPARPKETMQNMSIPAVSAVVKRDSDAPSPAATLIIRFAIGDLLTTCAIHRIWLDEPVYRNLFKFLEGESDGFSAEQPHLVRLSRADGVVRFAFDVDGYASESFTQASVRAPAAACVAAFADAARQLRAFASQ